MQSLLLPCLFSLCSHMNGSRANLASFEALQELATICALCNESSIDYNDVSTGGFAFHPNISIGRVSLNR